MLHRGPVYAQQYKPPCFLGYDGAQEDDLDGSTQSTFRPGAVSDEEEFDEMLEEYEHLSLQSEVGEDAASKNGSADNAVPVGQVVFSQIPVNPENADAELFLDPATPGMPAESSTGSNSANDSDGSSVSPNNNPPGSPMGSEETPESEPDEAAIAQLPEVLIGQADWSRATMPVGGMPIGIGCVIEEMNGELFVGTLLGMVTGGDGAVSAVRWAVPGCLAVAQDNFFRRRSGVLICHPWDFVHGPTFFKARDWTHSGLKVGCCAGCPPGAGNPLRCNMCIYTMLQHRRQAFDRGLLPMPDV
jgi:hypothetical protein